MGVSRHPASGLKERWEPRLDDLAGHHAPLPVAHDPIGIDEAALRDAAHRAGSTANSGSILPMMSALPRSLLARVVPPRMSE